MATKAGGHLVPRKDWTEKLTKVALGLVPSDRLDLFLIGADVREKTSMRYKVKNVLEAWSRARIHYPEDMFTPIMNSGKTDLLTLETYLARSVRAIVICLESPGSIAELGAFAASLELRPKIVIVNNRLYKDKRSFINDGPIRLVSDSAGRPLYADYGTPELSKGFADRLKDRIRDVGEKATVSNGLDNLVVVQATVLLTVGVLEQVSSDTISQVLELMGAPLPVVFGSASVAGLIRLRAVQLNHGYYALTGHGYRLLCQYIRPTSTARVVDSLRASILTAKYRRVKKHFEERAL